MASASVQAAEMMDLLGLCEDELCRTLAVDPLTLLSDQLDHRPEVGILLALLREPAGLVGQGVLRCWVRAGGPGGRPSMPSCDGTSSPSRTL